MRPFTAPSELVVYAAELGAALTRACAISATKRLWLALVCLGAIAAHAQNTNEPTPKTELGMGIAVLQFPASVLAKQMNFVPAQTLDIADLLA
jgi:hypothetical protein